MSDPSRSRLPKTSKTGLFQRILAQYVLYSLGNDDTQQTRVNIGRNACRGTCDSPMSYPTTPPRGAQAAPGSPGPPGGGGPATGRSDESRRVIETKKYSK